MPNLPPHLIDEEDILEKELSQTKIFSSYGQQGPSKYGKGGSRAYKAKGRNGK